jgi:CheY-like chemotaxis protein
VEAATAEDAFTILRTDVDVDIVLSDADVLRVMNGFSLTDEIRRSRPEIKLMLTSGIEAVVDNICKLCEQGSTQRSHDPEEVRQHIRMLREHRHTTIARS